MTNRKCFSSITSSFASIYLISAFFIVSFFSLLYLKYPPQYINNHFDYLHIIKLNENNNNNPSYEETPPISLTDDDDFSTPPPSVSLLNNNNNNESSSVTSAPTPSSPPPSPPPSPPSSPIDEDEEDEEEEEEGAIVAVDHLSYPPENSTVEERKKWIKQKLPESRVVESTATTRRFEKKFQSFVRSRKCKSTIFMTWISTTRFFRKREMLSLESVLKTHPESCVIIVSRIMASKQGFKMLEPLFKKGKNVIPVAPDFSLLFEGTPAHDWLQKLKDGQTDPGKIPITQNLSNLLRIALLYKYGGVYLDTDMIMVKDSSKLKNTIGIQEVDEKTTTWNSVNNAVLIFDKGHPLLMKFMEEFAATFDGNLWGYNGPYMATRIIKKIVYDTNYQFNIMSPLTFYPVDWFNIHRFFWNAKAHDESKWAKDMETKVRTQSYGVHLWNKISSPLKIEQGSIIGRLMSDFCIICQDIYGS